MEYRGIGFPFAVQPAPACTMTAEWRRTQCTDDLRTWSAEKKDRSKPGTDAMVVFLPPTRGDVA